MEATGFPTSADIYLELDGRKIAVVQGYTARASKSSQSVEAFGESEPVATVGGQTRYTLELSRLYATDEAIGDGVSHGFNVSIHGIIEHQNFCHFASLLVGFSYSGSLRSFKDMTSQPDCKNERHFFDI